MQTVGIVGLGALGVLFGQRLLENGVDVRVIADEARAERYQKQGVICNGTPVNFRYETPKTAKPVDLMIFATKESGLRGAMETASGFIGENTLQIYLVHGMVLEVVWEQLLAHGALSSNAKLDTIYKELIMLAAIAAACAAVIAVKYMIRRIRVRRAERRLRSE